MHKKKKYRLRIFLAASLATASPSIALIMAFVAYCGYPFKAVFAFNTCFIFSLSLLAILLFVQSRRIIRSSAFERSLAAVRFRRHENTVNIGDS